SGRSPTSWSSTAGFGTRAWTACRTIFASYKPRRNPMAVGSSSTGTPMTLADRWRSWAPYLLSLLRIIGAFLFVQYGSAKLLAWPAAVMPGGGTAPLTSLAGVAGALELVGGA